MSEATAIFGGIMFAVFLISVVIGCFLALKWANKHKDADREDTHAQN